jgi:hypothetical protein
MAAVATAGCNSFEVTAHAATAGSPCISPTSAADSDTDAAAACSRFVSIGSCTDSDCAGSTLLASGLWCCSNVSFEETGGDSAAGCKTTGTTATNADNADEAVETTVETTVESGPGSTEEADAGEASANVRPVSVDKSFRTAVKLAFSVFTVGRRQASRNFLHHAPICRRNSAIVSAQRHWTIFGGQNTSAKENANARVCLCVCARACVCVCVFVCVCECRV